MENDIVRMLFLRRQRQKKRWKIRTISGAPPLSFKAKAGALKDYRIYGNTAGGESVGDRTANLFSAKLTQGGYSSVSTPNSYQSRVRSSDNDFVFLNAGTYTISWDSDTETAMLMYAYNSESIDDYNSLIISAWTSSPVTFSVTSDVFVLVVFKKENNKNIIPKEISNIMLNEGSTALPYEPYGYKVPVTVEGKNLSEVNEFSNSITDTSNTLNIWVQQGKNDSFVYPSQSKIFVITEPTAITTSITITNDNDSIRIKHNGSKSDIVIDIVCGLSPGAYSVSFNVLNYDRTTVGGLVINNIMVNKGSTPLPYEPYRTPVTTPIYLPEPLKMVGDEAEYIDYAEQKQHRIGAEDIDVILPELPTLAGTNVLTVGTAVQPSDVYIKGRIKKGE